MQQPAQALLSVRNLSIGFGAEAVVRGVSFDLLRGKTLALVGESGSGKSLTALAIAGLLPSGATVAAESEVILTPAATALNITRMREQNLAALRGKDIGFVFQEPMSSLNPVMRCGAQVAEALQQHMGLSAAAAKQSVLRLFDEVQLPAQANAWHAYPHQLSGGQKQRVMIAMAIACSPALLIADEPTTALDATVQLEIVQLLKRLQQARNMGLLFITHDLALVRSLADDVAVMRHGRIVEMAPATQLFANPTQAYTRGLLACRPAAARRGQPLPTLDEWGEQEMGAKIDKVNVENKDSNGLVNNPLLLEISGLDSYFEQDGWLPWRHYTKPGLNGIGFSLKRGETLGIVGESGSGKTTLGRILAGLLATYAGNIVFDGVPIAHANTAHCRQLSRRIQLIFQDSMAALNPYKTIGQALLEPLVVHNLYGTPAGRHQALAALVARVHLPADTPQRYPHQFSGGQRQRICIVRALLLQPELLILDEAVSALDVSLQAEIVNLLSELKAEFGLSYLFITHDLNLVQYFCDRVVVLRNGAKVDEGPAETLFADSSVPYTRQLAQAALL
jgi:peptide/nickel transport system ATP-binding protein